MSYFLRIFCDGQEPSFGRWAFAFVLLCSTCWVTYGLVKTGHADFSGVTLYTTSLGGILYGGTKIASVIESKKG